MRIAPVTGLVAVLLASFACGNELLPPVIPISIAVTPDQVGLVVGGTLQMHASRQPEGDSTFSWSVSNTALADISTTGLLTAKRAGLIAVVACLAADPRVCGAATISLAELASPPTR
jgi:hypothetical protein